MTDKCQHENSQVVNSSVKRLNGAKYRVRQRRCSTCKASFHTVEVLSTPSGKADLHHTPYDPEQLAKMAMEVLDKGVINVCSQVMFIHPTQHEVCTARVKKRTTHKTFGLPQLRVVIETPPRFKGDQLDILSINCEVV